MKLGSMLFKHAVKFAPIRLTARTPSVTYLYDDIPGEHRAGTGHECGENGVRSKNIAIWVFSGKLGGEGREE